MLSQNCVDERYNSLLKAIQAEMSEKLQSKWKLCAVGFMQLSLERVAISTWGLQESV